jgi:glycerophosphoryl diester phosphodiesterase
MKKDHWLITRPVIHRGFYKKGIVENTIESFEEAVELGYPIEMDLRITNSGTVILFHDTNIKRLTGINKFYFNLTNEDLKNIKYKDSDSHISKFKDVLEYIDGRVPLLIELKFQGDFWNMKRLARETNKLLSNYKGEYAIQSFYPGMSKIYKKLNKNALVGLIAPLFSPKKTFLNDALLRLSLNFYKYDFISYDIRYMPNKIIKKLNIPILYYGIKDKRLEDIARSYNGNIIWNNVNGYYAKK